MLSRFLNRNKAQRIDRDGDRYDITLRVLSRDLPDYRGITLDLSSSGVQLETGGLLEVGTEPVLKFEFDRGELESFECRAKVVWSRKEENSQRKYRSGLTFIPQTDDEKRQIARMATVLQTRSETDLKTLLDQALRIDPELERSFADISSNQAGQSTQAESTTPAEAPKNSRHPGLYIPLEVSLEGYTWNRGSRVLHLGLREKEQIHSLYFPNCQLFQVMEPAADETILGLYSTMTSPTTRKLELADSQREFKHYRFVAQGGKGLIDIVSGPCQAQP